MLPTVQTSLNCVSSLHTELVFPHTFHQLRAEGTYLIHSQQIKIRVLYTLIYVCAMIYNTDINVLLARANRDTLGWLLSGVLYESYDTYKPRWLTGYSVTIKWP